MPWSSGQAKGHINRLKLLKRQMYGRAGLRSAPPTNPPHGMIHANCGRAIFLREDHRFLCRVLMKEKKIVSVRKLTDRATPTGRCCLSESHPGNIGRCEEQRLWRLSM